MATISCWRTRLRALRPQSHYCCSPLRSVGGSDRPAGNNTNGNSPGTRLGALSTGSSSSSASLDLPQNVDLSEAVGFTLKIGMKFSVDAHAIGRHLTGNEVYIRNLLNGFAGLDRDSEFIAYLSIDGPSPWVPSRFTVRRVSANPYARLGFDLSAKLRQDRPDLLHVQYTAPLACPVPVVVSIHDVSFREHPQFFPRFRARQLRWTVARTVRS